jgi:SAM-dependent methyltransferase
LKGALPERFHIGLDAGWSRLTWPMYVGEARECPICGGHFSRFLPLHHRADVRCPRCRSFDRHRLLWVYLREQTDLFTAPHRLLHLAPEPVLQRKFRALSNIDYVSADLSSPAAMVHTDITDMVFDDAEFDVVLCSHVLEHIPDDRRAMRELWRVMKPGGWGIFQVPMSGKDVTFEDPSVTDPAERERLFGQFDHVRWYGRDYRDRLVESGFEVTVDDFVRRLVIERVERLGLPPEEDLYICRKPAG